MNQQDLLVTPLHILPYLPPFAWFLFAGKCLTSLAVKSRAFNVRLRTEKQVQSLSPIAVGTESLKFHNLLE